MSYFPTHHRSIYILLYRLGIRGWISSSLELHMLIKEIAMQDIVRFGEDQRLAEQLNNGDKDG